MKNEKILITGSQGFIGTALTQNISIENSIIGINNKADQNKKNYKSIKKNIETMSINDIPDKIDGIIHLAAVTDVNFCDKFPAKCFKTNVLGTANILDLARKKDCKVVFVSTSHVYGKPIKKTIKEDHPRNPLSVYALSKLEGEICCEGFSKMYDMDISIVRLFSVYGMNSPEHLVTSKIISQLNKKSIKLGNTSTRRDFVYLDDAIQAIKLIHFKSKGFNTFNVGTGKSHSIKEVCNIIKKITNKNTPIESIPSLKRNVDVTEIVANISKIKKLGWSPSISLEDGLKKLLARH